MATSLPFTVMDAAMVAQTMPGRPMTTHHALEVRARLEERHLVAAAEALLAETPALRTIVRQGLWRASRWIQPVDATKARAVVQLRPTPTDLGTSGWLDAPFALDREWPVRVLATPERHGHTTLVFTLHHSVTDGRGALGFFDRYLALLVAAREGRTLEPLPPTPPGPTLGGELRKRPALVSQLLRTLAENPTRFWKHRAAVLERPEAERQHTGLRVDDVPLETWRRLQLAARALGCTRNDLLWCAAVRAADGFRRARGLPDETLRLVGGVDLRKAFGIEHAEGNWIGTMEADFSPTEARGDGLEALMHRRLAEAHAPERALVTPLLLGALGTALPTRGLREVFRRADQGATPFMYSMLLSHIRPPGTLCWPQALDPVRLWCASSLPRKPGLGITVTTTGEHVTLATVWPSPMSTVPAVDDFVNRLLEALEALAVTPAIRSASRAG